MELVPEEAECMTKKLKNKLTLLSNNNQINLYENFMRSTSRSFYGAGKSSGL